MWVVTHAEDVTHVMLARCYKDAERIHVNYSVYRKLVFMPVVSFYFVVFIGHTLKVKTA